MNIDDYKEIFEEKCKNLELPCDKVRALAIAISGLHPEFKERDSCSHRIGILGVSTSLCQSFGANAGELIIAAKNIQVGCEILRTLWDDTSEYSGQPGLRWNVVLRRYIGEWPGMIGTYELKIDYALKKIRQENET